MAIGRGATGAAAGAAGAARFAAGFAVEGFLFTGFFFAACLEADRLVGFFLAVLTRLAALRAADFRACVFAATFRCFRAGALRVAFFLALAMCPSVGSR
jgi:hypothetical protein